MAASDALLWAEGRLTDAQLLLNAPLAPEAVFVVDLPSRDAYRELLFRCRHWAQRGAVCLIARTANPAVDGHFLKNRALVTFREAWKGKDTQYRFFMPPGSFLPWVGKWTRRSAGCGAPCPLL